MPNFQALRRTSEDPSMNGEESQHNPGKNYTIVYEEFTKSEEELRGRSAVCLTSFAVELIRSVS